MKQVAIAFETTRDASAKDHRLRSLLAVEQVDGELTGRSFAFTVAGQGTAKFSETAHLLAALTADGTVVVHQAAAWRRVVRYELGSKKDRNSRRLLENAFDLSGWSRQQFPRQRTSLDALTRRLKLEIGGDYSGLRLEAERLLRIGAIALAAPRKLETSPATNSAVDPVQPEAMQVPDSGCRNDQSWSDRLRSCVQALLGRI